MEQTGFLPFALPDIGEDEISEVVDSLRSGWLTTGPKSKRFEKEFEDFIGRETTAIAVNSATGGLHLAVEALGIGVGDEVITTPYTFTATAEVVRYLGADPIFVDINPATFNIDPEELEKVISRRLKAGQNKIKAIIPVHFAGLACEMTPILQIARKYGLHVIEDAAHALPTIYKNNMIGTLDSDITVFSFYATKTITTGEGGMIVTRNPEIANRCKTMRLHGISRDSFDRYTSTQPSWRYEVVGPGYKYNLTDVAASLGIHQLKKAWTFQKKRAAMAARYDEAFKNHSLILPPKARPDDVHAWHLYVIRLQDNTKISRDQFIELMAKKGIGCSVHFIPLHLHPYWRDTYKLNPNNFPNALHAYEKAISIPLYTKMTEDDQVRVIQAVHDILQ